MNLVRIFITILVIFFRYQSWYRTFTRVLQICLTYYIVKSPDSREYIRFIPWYITFCVVWFCYAPILTVKAFLSEFIIYFRSAPNFLVIAFHNRRLEHVNIGRSFPSYKYNLWLLREGIHNSRHHGTRALWFS